MLKTSIPVILSVILSGCGLEKDGESGYSSVKTITTIYKSYQPDTKQKDNNTIAKVWFHPDGTIKEFTQYMTYPYDFPDPKPVEFWTDSVNMSAVPLIMDGIELGIPERNFLYGNDWPKLYLKIIEEKGHQYYPKGPEMFSYSKNVEYDLDLPVRLTLKLEDHPVAYPFIGVIEHFEYDNSKVTRFREEAIINEESPLIKGDTVYQKQKQALKKAAGSRGSLFEYDGDKLVRYTGGDHVYKFYYDEKFMTRSEFFIGDKMYNYRMYVYNSKGQKEKTEMYNVDNQLEYEIMYSYEYY